jgi:small subunit ribosomal protein S2
MAQAVLSGIEAEMSASGIDIGASEAPVAETLPETTEEESPAEKAGA